MILSTLSVLMDVPSHVFEAGPVTRVSRPSASRSSAAGPTRRHPPQTAAKTITMNREIPNNYREKPIEYYKAELQKLDAQEIAARCGLKQDGDAVLFTIMGCQYRIMVPSFEYEKLTAEKPDFLAAQGTQVFVLHFLTRGSYAETTGKFISFREYPGGELYYKAFEGRCLKRLAYSYGIRLITFGEKCSLLGGKEISGGDAAYEFEFMPGFLIRLIIWGPDEEFPPAAQMLFSDNFPVSFLAEGAAGIGDILIGAIKRAR